LKAKIEKYFKGDEEVLLDIFEAVLKRKLVGKHEDTDDELLDEFQMQPLQDVKDKDFESDFEEMHETDEEIDDLYDAMDIVKHEIKEKVDKKFNEIAAMIEAGEIAEEKGYELFKEYEDKMVLECAKLMEAEGPPQFDDAKPDTKKDIDDPPGEGAILRWKSRCVFAPGGDAWHPKNRKLELNKHEFRRLRELVGKRYHPGKDELMITSERFEHREENRKDCLRTLYALLEESYKANQLVHDTRTSYVKERLRANPQFMERLRAKTLQNGASLPS
ncbi:hypothetical protein AG4045_004716, partial [Apium graveolens]